MPAIRRAAMTRTAEPDAALVAGRTQPRPTARARGVRAKPTLNGAIAYNRSNRRFPTE